MSWYEAVPSIVIGETAGFSKSKLISGRNDEDLKNNCNAWIYCFIFVMLVL